MKKIGFTLAEVLITLSIIGVVAALTLPTLSNNAHAQANAAKLSSTVSALENAFGIILTADPTDPVELHDITYANGENFYSKIADHLKTLGTEVPTVTYSVAVPSSTVFMTKSGAIVYIEDNQTAADDDANGNVDNYYGNLYIDVNGEAKPNVLGKDLFSFHLGEDGILYPMDDETKNLVKNGYKVK